MHLTRTEMHKPAILTFMTSGKQINTFEIMVLESQIPAKPGVKAGKCRFFAFLFMLHIQGPTIALLYLTDSAQY